MKITYNWLKEYVAFDLDPVELADMLTMLGLEVEAMESVGQGMDDVVVARVLEKRPHPNADKLSLCKVDNGVEVLDVVCGASNFSQGDTVVLAQTGATLPGNFKIKRSKIRGEESCGMLCSEKELGLADESAGIMVLAGSLPLGTPVFDALGIKDTIFEIGLTPNRADCLSSIGIAREVAAKLGTTIRYPETECDESNTPVETKIRVKVEAPDLCPRYAARYISGCRIAPSPEWLVSRLTVLGIRSINNVVDVTNLVMMELGQPLHAFDCAQLAEQSIVVRRATEGELFVTLDSQSRQLTAADLVICDAERPVALAGIMGGENSEISADTTTILLESAQFQPTAIRKTSKRLGLHTESSHRFERGIDREGVLNALNRAARLIAELSGGEVAKGYLDVSADMVMPPPILFRPERANALIGSNLTGDQMARLLSCLGCAVVPTAAGALQVTPPSYRVDIEREIDLVEEVARLNGFGSIEATMPVARVVSDRPTVHQSLEKRVRDLLVAAGMHEVINFSFTAPGMADRLLLDEQDPRRSSIGLLNPLMVEHSIMRTSLLPGILETVSRNMSFRSLDLRLFEMRRIYLPQAGEDMPHEPLCITGAITGSRDGDSWTGSGATLDFYDAKGLLEFILSNLSITKVTWVADNPEPYYHPGVSCSIMVGAIRLGSVGELHPVVLDNFSLEKPVYCFEIDFDALLKVAGSSVGIIAPSRFPDSTRDIAVLVPTEMSAEQIIGCIRSVKAKEIEDVSIFDVYAGKGIPDGCKSIAVRVRYRSYERTLTDEEVEAIHGKIIANLINKLKVSVR